MITKWKIALTILLTLIMLPVQAGQFKEFRGIVINKQLVISVNMDTGGVKVRHPGNYICTYFPVKDKSEKIKLYNEIKAWLMEKQ